MKKLLALILVAVMCMSFAACMETDEPVKDDSPANASTESVSEDAKEETYGLNETAVFKNLKFTATAIEESEGIDYFEAESGKIYVGVKFTVENISEEEQNVSSLLLFEGYVDDVKCDYSLGAAMAFEGSLDGAIAPGKKLVGYYALELPEDWKKLELDVQANWLSSKSARFVFEKKG